MTTLARRPEIFIRPDGPFFELTTAYSTRADGNMALRLSPIKSDVMENRKKFAEAHGINPESGVFMEAYDTEGIQIVDQRHIGGLLDPRKMIFDTDALVTFTELPLMVTVGDCPPVSIYHPRKRIHADIHVSTKQTEKDFVDKVLTLIEGKMPLDRGELRASVGPSVCPDHYELDWLKTNRLSRWLPDFIKTSDGNAPRIQPGENGDLGLFIINSAGDKGRLLVDLPRAIYASLVKFGIKPGNISQSMVNTCCETPTMFSHAMTRINGEHIYPEGRALAIARLSEVKKV